MEVKQAKAHAAGFIQQLVVCGGLAPKVAAAKYKQASEAHQKQMVKLAKIYDTIKQHTAPAKA